MRTIVKREECTVERDYRLDITPEFVKEIEEFLKQKWEIEVYGNDFTLAEEDVIFAFCFEYGVIDSGIDSSKVNEGLIKARATHKNYNSLSREVVEIIADYVNDKCWEVEPEEVDSVTNYCDNRVENEEN